MVVVSHLFLFLKINSGADKTHASHVCPLFRTVYFQTAPFIVPLKDASIKKRKCCCCSGVSFDIFSKSSLVVVGFSNVISKKIFRMYI